MPSMTRCADACARSTRTPADPAGGSLPTSAGVWRCFGRSVEGHPSRQLMVRGRNPGLDRRSPRGHNGASHRRSTGERLGGRDLV